MSRFLTAALVFALFLVLGSLCIPSFAGETAVPTNSPDDWRFMTVRDETAPRSSVARENGTFGLAIAGTGSSILHLLRTRVGYPRRPPHDRRKAAAAS